MSAPPGKERGGHFVTAPTSSTGADTTALICATQHESARRTFNEAPPPHSVEAEQGVLSSMLQPHGGSEAIAKVVQKITADHFFVPAHQTVFDVALDFHDAGKAIDLVTFTQALRDRGLLENVGGAAFVTELSGFVPSPANVDSYIDIVREKFTLRSIIAAATESALRAREEQADVAETLAFVSEQFAAIEHNGRNGQFPAIADAAELISKPIILPDDVVQGVLHRGAKMELGGASKTFKTWTLIELAISVATGTDWLGRFSTKRGRVLYVNLELPDAFFTQRTRTLCDERQIKLEPGYLKVWNLRGHAADLSKMLPRLLRGIGRDEFVLIILDPIYKLLGARDENKAGDVASLLNEIEQLAVRTGAAVAFGAHYSKGNQAKKEAIDRVGGSGVFGRDPDSILDFTRHEQDDCFSVEATLRNHPPIQPFVVRWEFPLLVVDESLDPTDLKKAGRKPETSPDDVLDLLAAKPLTEAEWRELARKKLHISRRTFERRLAAIKVKKSAVFEDDGKWHATF
jgi:hypothetical protein